MPVENVKIIERIYSGMQQRDFAMVSLYFDPEVEICQSETVPWGGRYRGYDGLAKFFAKLAEHIESRVETERLIDAGDSVVQIGYTRGTAKRGGRAFDVPEVHVWKFRDGKIIGFTSYIDIPMMMTALEG